MYAHNANIRDLRIIGTDQEIANFCFTKSEFIVMRRSLGSRSKQKISNLDHQKGAIIADIYSCRYGRVQEYGLADSTDFDDFHAKLESLQEEWNRLSPSLHKWFCKKWKLIFVQSVIETARSGTVVQGLLYNNNLERQHFHEKLEQSYKNSSLETVFSTLQKLIERQENGEIKAIHRSGSYSLSKQYSKFKIDSVKWYSMANDYRRKHVKKFEMYKPTLDDEYVKPKKSGTKPSDDGKRILKQQETEVIVDRHAKRIRNEDPNCEPEIPFQLFFQPLVPKLLEKCQSNLGRKLSQSNEEGYLLIKWTHNVPCKWRRVNESWPAAC